MEHKQVDLKKTLKNTTSEFSLWSTGISLTFTHKVSRNHISQNKFEDVLMSRRSQEVCQKVQEHVKKNFTRRIGMRVS